MIVYLDSSVVLRPLFAQPGRLRSWGTWTAAYSSELLGVECRRAIDRLRLEGLYDDARVAEANQELTRIERTIRQVRISRSIIQEALRTMPTIVKTLDALHLATAVVLRGRRHIDLQFSTHDVQQGIAARALGFTTLES